MIKTEPALDYAALYRQAFEEYGAIALWSSRPVPDPTPADALAITRSLRVEGDLGARRLAEQIEQAVAFLGTRTEPASDLAALYRAAFEEFGLF